MLQLLMLGAFRGAVTSLLLGVTAADRDRQAS